MPQPDLTGTTVIVTGAAGGLGGVMTLGARRAGASVAAFDIEASKPYMDEVLGQARDRQLAARVKPFWCDVRDPAAARDAVEAAARAFGRIDGLVNGAGLGPVYHPGGNRQMKFWEVDLEVWKSRIDANLTGPFIMAKTVAPRFVAQKRGKIVNVTTSYSTMVRRRAHALWPVESRARGGEPDLVARPRRQRRDGQRARPRRRRRHAHGRARGRARPRQAGPAAGDGGADSLADVARGRRRHRPALHRQGLGPRARAERSRGTKAGAPAAW